MDTEEKELRISVCMKRMFSDERARVLVSVLGTRRVRWLQQRLRATFRLRGAFCLVTRGHLLPPAEPLALLRTDDLVQVVPIKENWFEENDNVVSDTDADVNSDQPLCGDGPPLAGCQPENENGNILDNSDLHTDECDSSLPHGTNSTNERLQQLKRDALALLDSYRRDSCRADDAGETCDTEASQPPRSKRRRVRRRRRAPSPLLSTDLSPPSPRSPLPSEIQLTNASVPPSAPHLAPHVAPHVASLAPPVLRNEPQPRRAARVVRAVVHAAI